VWGDGNCLGNIGAVVGRTNYSPNVHDLAPVRDVDEMGGYSGALRDSLVFAEGSWNTLGVGPQYFSTFR